MEVDHVVQRRNEKTHHNRAWGSSPKSAKTHGKEPLCPSTWESCASEKGGISGMPRDIAQNYGVHVAVGAMFTDQTTYFV
jgi:hypothetical protein